MSESYNCVRIIIANSTSKDKNILGAKEELCQLKVGDEIEIDFKEIGESANYEIIKKEEKWEMNDDGSDANWYIYTVQFIKNIPHK